MKRYAIWVGILLFVGMLVSCGGGGGGGGSSSSAAPTGGGTPAGTPPNGGGGTDTSTRRFEENDATFVTRSGDWTASDPHAGWSKGAALESSAQGASITFSFTGTSVRWIGARGRDGGIASVQVDGAEVKQVNLFARPSDEFRTPCFTIYDLTPGPHTLTIVVTGNKDGGAAATSPGKVWVDAFEVNPMVVSHLQESDPAVAFSDGWAVVPTGLFWSGSGASNDGEPPVGAMVTETAGATATLQDNDRHLNVRGTSISWIGYRGPDAGIAAVSVDNGPEVLVDTYGDTFKVQEVLFTASGLADTEHTLRIRATGDKNPKSSAAKIFVDAFDVAKPGKRFEDDSTSANVSVTFGNVPGVPGSSWTPNNARVWSEGLSRTNVHQGASATFTFTGTSVSWIGCEKSTIGSARVFLDDQPPVDINMNKPVANAQGFAVQGFQRTIFRKDGLTKGPHTLRIEVTSNNNNFVVVDAFDILD
jgi:hypothetical protein